MLKKLIIIAIAAQTISIQASDHVKPLTILQKLAPSYWLLGINPNLPLNARCVGGTLTGNLATTTENINLGLDKLLDAEKVEKASNAAGHGFVYGVVSAPFHAARDGAVYMKDTAVEHPYAAGAIITASALSVVYHMIPSQEEVARQEQIKQDAIARKQRSERETIEHKNSMDTMNTATEFRTCLNTHHRSMVKEDRLPRNCHSPARRLGLLDRVKAEEILDGFNKFRG